MHGIPLRFVPIMNGPDSNSKDEVPWGYEFELRPGVFCNSLQLVWSGSGRLLDLVDLLLFEAEIKFLAV